MSAVDNCVFCKIVKGELPAVKLFEDADTLAFMDVFPASAGHALVICRNHHANLLDMPDDSLAATAIVARRVAQAIMTALRPDGFQIRQFNGEAAGQTVFHYHVHIVPVHQGVGAPAHGRERSDPRALEELAARIRTALA